MKETTMKLSMLIFACFALFSYLERENFSLQVQGDQAAASATTSAAAPVPELATKKVPNRYQPTPAKVPAKATAKRQPTQKPKIKSPKKSPQKPTKKKRVIKKETKPGRMGTARPNAAWFLSTGYYNERSFKK